MPHPSQRKSPNESSTGSVLAMLAERSQLDFELGFFETLLDRLPDYTDAIRAHAANLALKGHQKESLLAEQRLADLRPTDPDVHYNLACRYAVLKQPDLAMATLRKAVELGYRDFRTMIQDPYLETLRRDPRFRAILREHNG